MQKVSKEYKASMKSSLRERAYIMLSFGLINQEAQANAKIDSNGFTYFSNKNNVFQQREISNAYATLEQDFTKVDGSMFFLPRRKTSNYFYDAGIVSDKLISEMQCEVSITLNIAPISFRGLTIEFGENYPVDFDVVGSREQKIEVRANGNETWSTEEVIENTNSIRLIFYKMKNHRSRLRIRFIKFGYGLIYHNDSVITSRMDSYVSQIAADIPQIDFTVTLKNHNKYFNVDNPKSAINFLETGQEMNVYYGYKLPESDHIEWVKGNRLLCSEWESDDHTAIIRCQDVFRTMNSEYSKGRYGSVSYYDLATRVLQDAGQTDYYIDQRLRDLYTTNPLPRVKHKEALQIIANACRCVLSQTRSGKIQIKSNFIPKTKQVSSNGETEYSNVENIVDARPKKEYASFASDYTTTDGTMFFLPRNNPSLFTGYVSSSISNGECLFDTNPTITLWQEAQCAYHGVKLVFGNSLPSAFIIRTYNDNEPVNTYEISDEITKDMMVHEVFDDFDKMEIEFTKTNKPNNRIVLNHLIFGDVTDFTMNRNDMTSSPKVIKQELVKEIIVPHYSYRKGSQIENLISEDVRVQAGEVRQFFIGEASHDFSVTLNESTSGVSILEQGSYFVTVKFLVSGNYRFELLGYRYKIVEQYSTKKLHERGRSIKWENPLISDLEMANDLTEWLSKYYSSGIEYEYDTRGFPELDANDTIYQENEFHDEMKVNISRHSLIFDKAFKGKMTVRRKGE